MKKHSISLHLAKRIILVKPTGLWSVTDYHAYANDMLDVVAAAGRPFDVMTDMSERITQTSEVAALLDEFAGRLSAMGLRRFVVVGASPLLALQAKRVAKIATPHLVSSLDEGYAWLSENADRR